MIPALFLLSAGFAAAQAPAALPTEKQLAADASGWVESLCKAGPQDKCEAARGALAGYRSLLPETAACEAKGCDGARIFSLIRSLTKFNETAAGMPAVPGQPLNALLRLGALGGVRLAAAASHNGEKNTTVAPLNSESGAATAVEVMCLQDPGSCDGYRSTLSDARSARRAVDSCLSSPCSFAQVDTLAYKAHATMVLSLKSPPTSESSNLPLFSYANAAEEDSIKLLAAFVNESVDKLKGGADAFEKKVAAAEKDSGADARALPGEAEAVMASYQEASFAADRLADLLGYEKAGAKRDAVNAQAVRLGALRSRAFAAITARGLGQKATDGLAVLGMDAPGGPAALKPGVVLSGAKPTLLDKRSLPLPSSVVSPPPPIIPGDPSVVANLLNAASKDPLLEADARRRLGMTTTVGAPGLYAKYAYHQAAGDTCGVAAQVQALRAAGLLPASETPEQQEKDSASRLAAKGYYDKGTSDAYAGELLIANGVVVQKQIKAQWPDLEQAVRRGSLLQTAVDARTLWGIAAAKPLQHSILVTGGEVDKTSGRLLGVYINDSGANPAKGGRFVPLAQFKAMWQPTFVEVIR